MSGRRAAGAVRGEVLGEPAGRGVPGVRAGAERVALAEGLDGHGWSLEVSGASADAQVVIEAGVDLVRFGIESWSASRRGLDLGQCLPEFGSAFVDSADPAVCGLDCVGEPPDHRVGLADLVFVISTVQRPVVSLEDIAGPVVLEGEFRALSFDGRPLEFGECDRSGEVVELHVGDRDGVADLVAALDE